MVLANIIDYLNTFMVFNDTDGLEAGDQAFGCALWALSTWTFSESFPRLPLSTPYLFVNSETPRAGKTLLIDLLEPIVLNPERTIDMTKAVLFKLIEERHPTLFIDEIDALTGAARESMRGTLNGGYKPSGYVWRQIGNELVKFRTFSAKLLAGIYTDGLLDETVESRCLFINLRRVATLNKDGQIVAPDGTTRETYYSFMAEPQAEKLTYEIQEFMARWAQHWEQHIPKPIPGISPRAWEIAMPLVQIARELGIEQEARERLARLFVPRKDKEAPEIGILRAIRTAFDESGHAEMFSSDLSAVAYPEMSAVAAGKLIGNRLGQYIDGASTTITIRNRKAKGYYRHQFERAFREYL